MISAFKTPQIMSYSSEQYDINFNACLVLSRTLMIQTFAYYNIKILKCVR